MIEWGYWLMHSACRRPALISRYGNYISGSLMSSENFRHLNGVTIKPGTVPRCDSCGERLEGHVFTNDNLVAIDRHLINEARDARRYRYVRTLQPVQWAAIFAANIAGQATFDELIDRALDAKDAAK